MTSLEEPWDLLVVGGGTAGIVGAKTAARLGARVALVERERTGGDCLWTGCVPSKALLAAASRAAGARSASALGVHVEGVRVDLAEVLGHVNATISAIEPQDSPHALRAAGVVVLHGNAEFTGPTTVEVDGMRHAFRQALIATGGTPSMPEVPGLAESAPLTSDTVWDLAALPARLVVMGGGSIGCELSQAFARLGSSVTLIEAAPRLLTHEDPDAAALVHAALERDGVTVMTGHTAALVKGGNGEAGIVVVDGPHGAADVPYDSLLVAVGRSPRSHDLGLDRAGVGIDPRGFVAVDRRLRTSNPRVWAAGDVTTMPQFTHLAGVHSALAAANAVLGLRRSLDLSAVPRVTFTDPEVASVGVATWSDGRRAPAVETVYHANLDRALADGRPDGFTRLALGKRGRIMGGTIVGPRAGEALAEVTVAVKHRLTATDLATVTHPYPTYADGVWNAAIAVAEARLATPSARRATRALVVLRRSLRGRVAR